MKKIIFISLFLLSLTILSFKSSKKLNNVTLVNGTYGVSESNFTLQLKLNDDQTFHYINNTNPKKPIDVKGNWQLVGKIIYLKDYKSAYQINTKWKIDDRYNGCACIKSRKGMEFLRICLVSKK